MEKELKEKVSLSKLLCVYIMANTNFVFTKRRPAGHKHYFCDPRV